MIDSCFLCCVSELRLKKLFEERESLRDQVRRENSLVELKRNMVKPALNSDCDPMKVRLLKSQLHQRNGTDRVQNPDGDGPEDGIDPHLLDLQSKSLSGPDLHVLQNR